MQDTVSLTARGAHVFGVQESEWNDWRWQLSHRLSSEHDFAKILQLDPDEREALRRREGRMRSAITPYYALLIDPDDPHDPIRRTMVPRLAEFDTSPEGYTDPCDEDAHQPVRGLVHRYPDRVLLLPTNQCPVYCRYCTRGRWVGGPVGYISDSDLDAIVRYLIDHPEVRDVLVSGGDPLILPDAKIVDLLARLRAIESIEILRIGTKVVPTLPMRITPDLVQRLREMGPLWVNIHFAHPREITEDVKAACARLADAGIQLNAQIVLLKDVNDSLPVMKRLCQELIRMRVRPYYLYQCDPVQWGLHFRTPVAKGIEMIEGLRGHTTGFAVPTFVIDAPGGGGKIPLQPNYVESWQDGVVRLRNYAGEPFVYLEPAECQDPIRCEPIPQR